MRSARDKAEATEIFGQLSILRVLGNDVGSMPLTLGGKRRFCAASEASPMAQFRPHVIVIQSETPVQRNAKKRVRSATVEMFDDTFLECVPTLDMMPKPAGGCLI